MTRVTGKALTRNVFDNMPANDKAHLAFELASFMAGLAAAFTGEEAKELVQLTGEYSLTSQSLQAALDNPEVRNLLRDNFGDIKNAALEYGEMLSSKIPVVIHDDFHMGNIIMSPDNRKMAGIIDFGYMNLGLPEEGLFSWGRAFPDFTKEICLSYSSLTGKEVSYRHYLLCNLSAKIKSISHACDTGVLKDIEDAKKRIYEILTLLG